MQVIKKKKVKLYFPCTNNKIENKTLNRARKSNGSLTPNRPDKEYPPHVPRDY